MNLRSAWILVLWLAAFSAWGRGGGGCFEQGTLVRTPAGQVRIEQLRIGDAVLSVQNGVLKSATVQSLFEVQPETYLEMLIGGRSLHVTAEHPIQTAPGIFRTAESLRPGDTLWLYDEGALVPTRLAAIRRYPAERPAYNLLVSPGGNYLADDILVHNKGCFLPDTPVLRADGTAISISAVQPGERLLAFTPEGKILTGTVENVITHQVEEYLVVTTESVQLRVTAEHPFYVGHGTFKTLEALRIGDTIFAHDGHAGLTPQHIVSLESVHVPVLVYNLQTDSPHTYFASGIAVHNKGGGCFPAGTLVHTPRGNIAIENLTVGDAVFAVEAGGALGATTVEACFTTESALLMLHTDRGTLATTAEHPLLGLDGAFHEADDFNPGDSIMAWRKGRLRRSRILSKSSATNLVTVYNLRVGGPHTYIAGGFVVHNKGGGGFGGSGGRGGGSGAPDEGLKLAAPTLFRASVVMGLLGAVVGILFARKMDLFGTTGARFYLAALAGFADGGLSMHVANFTIFGGLVLLAPMAIAMFAIYAAPAPGGELDYIYPRVQITPKAKKTAVLLEFIAKVDATFAHDKLTALTESTFRMLQKCWQERDYKPMQRLLMPDLYVEHVKQLAGLRRHGEINVIDHLEVLALDIVNVRHVHRADDREFTALITARARDCYIDDESKRVVRGDAGPAKFQEFWTFQLQSGKWLLREIEQAGESDILKDENVFEQFTDEGVRTIYDQTAQAVSPSGPWLDKATGTKADRTERLLNFLVTTDKLWNRQEMLEHARQTFMEVKLAWESGGLSADVVARLFPEVAGDFRNQLARQAKRQLKMEFRNLCVRKTELILVRNYADNRKDEFTVRITAHAQIAVRRDGLLMSQQDYVTPFEEYWTFGRLENRWKLKEVLPQARGQAAVSQENVDEESSPEQLQWYYQQTRAG